VIVASNLGRPEEKVKVVELSNFDPNEVDMLTIVMIGASSSKAFTRGSGITVAFTPRGYESKAARTQPAPPPTVVNATAAAAVAAAAALPPQPSPSQAPAALPEPVAAAAPVAPPGPPAPPPPSAASLAAQHKNPIRAGVAFLRNRARGSNLPEDQK
jgi:hypothetical protein